MRILLGLCAALVLAGCANSGTGRVPPETVEKVDLQRYQGTWYELARLPMYFQRDCAQSEAHYRLQEDGSVGVLNRCRTAEGQWQEASGRAEPQIKGQTSKLWVRFDNWFSELAPALSKGDYWVLYLDHDYRTALVGTPDHDYLWLLSRSAEVTQATRDKLLQEARQRGYDTTKLIWRTPDAKIGAKR
ncbi:lipocalin family protein [Pseudomonas sp. UL073]|uniref:Outer membrane lipoprotein Blc n=1 Tax=Zestomonas insulae TaxID=2809017 RepID=A0ABS2IDC2_9GAMM|nr:lipocalin family protein [Pseudomonas insulae]MBM7061104.1 lipocalin family protein [Pseudomonas insulae]